MSEDTESRSERLGGGGRCTKKGAIHEDISRVVSYSEGVAKERSLNSFQKPGYGNRFHYNGGPGGSNQLYDGPIFCELTSFKRIVRLPLDLVSRSRASIRSENEQRSAEDKRKGVGQDV